ncbi:hypothetical protein [Lentzea sp. NPDC092896]|uniref:hypothetical protein n=1 Tax=Lentzea sp. NPDC092896 TaxID=3364127 RepID=UPI00380D3222
MIVGVLGIAGVIGGQLVNAWREDRRWRRENEREDLRWRRENEREQVKSVHQDVLHWREKRLNYYGEYMALLDEWQELLRGPLVDVLSGEVVSVEVGERTTEITRRARAALGRILLIASEEVRKTTSDAYYLHSAVSYHVVRQGELRASDNGAVHPSGGHAELIRARRSVEAAFRVDLSVPEADLLPESKCSRLD